MPQSKAQKKEAARFIAAAVLTSFITCTAGCHSGDAPAASSPVPPPVQSQANTVQKVRDNPNIPPQAKANIIAHMQGTAPPPTSPGTSP